MKAPFDSRLLRQRGYEALFLLSGAVAMAFRPTLGQAFEIDLEIGNYLLRERELKEFRKRGLIEEAEKGAEGILRLTELGRRAFAGGRRPEESWNRPWDGQWRLVAFDLPRDARGTRAKFWRWLKANHFGRFQGSVWITPDPVPDIRKAARDAGLESSMLAVFTGQVDAESRPSDIAAQAWDFDGINRELQTYMHFADQILRQTRKRAPSADRLKQVLHEDRKQWWAAVQTDPLLPKVLCPPGYQGLPAWKLRTELHTTLLRSITPKTPG